MNKSGSLNNVLHLKMNSEAETAHLFISTPLPNTSPNRDVPKT